MTDRIAFLDIDGVLNTGRMQRNNQDVIDAYKAHALSKREIMKRLTFDGEAVANLNGFLARTGALIVVHSTWIHSLRGDEIVAVFERNGVPASAFYPKGVPVRMSAEKHEMIRMFLYDHPDVGASVIIDDSEAGIVPIGGPRPAKWVQPDPEVGLTAADVERAVHLLTGSET